MIYILVNQEYPFKSQDIFFPSFQSNIDLAIYYLEKNKDKYGEQFLQDFLIWLTMVKKNKRNEYVSRYKRKRYFCFYSKIMYLESMCLDPIKQTRPNIEMLIQQCRKLFLTIKCPNIEHIVCNSKK